MKNETFPRFINWIYNPLLTPLLSLWTTSQKDLIRNTVHRLGHVMTLLSSDASGLVGQMSKQHHQITPKRHLKPFMKYLVLLKNNCDTKIICKNCFTILNDKNQTSKNTMSQKTHRFLDSGQLHSSPSSITCPSVYSMGRLLKFSELHLLHLSSGYENDYLIRLL